MGVGERSRRLNGGLGWPNDRVGEEVKGMGEEGRVESRRRLRLGPPVGGKAVGGRGSSNGV